MTGLVLAAVGLAAAGWLVAGDPGLAVAGGAALGLVLLGLRYRLPPARAARARTTVPMPSPDAGFPSYRAIYDSLGWADTTARRFDQLVRPRLVDLAAARLAERAGVDLHHQPDRARDLLGADVWDLVDPHRPPRRGDDAPGEPLHRITVLVDRLEAL